jgi:ElaB/YqjD/DUF883 family membrane-anchored ribosome-binding protein
VTEQAKQAAAQVQERAGQAYQQASEKAGEAYEQATEKAGELSDEAREWARGAYDQASGWASEGGRRSVEGVRSAGSGVQRYVAENPVMVGLIGLAAGLLLGALLPRTRREDEAFGEWADEVREQSLRYAHEAAQRGRELVEEGLKGDEGRGGQPESEQWQPSSPGMGP